MQNEWKRDLEYKSQGIRNNIALKENVIWFDNPDIALSHHIYCSNVDKHAKLFKMQHFLCLNFKRTYNFLYLPMHIYYFNILDSINQGRKQIGFNLMSCFPANIDCVWKVKIWRRQSKFNIQWTASEKSPKRQI